MNIRQTSAQLRMQQRQKGFTLTEIAIVLGIIGMILGAIWVAAAGVYNNQRINQGNTAVLQILQAVRTLYAQQATITPGDRTSDLIGAGVIPTNLINGTAMRSPWGQPMFVGGSSDSASIVIVLNNMSAALCVGIISSIGGASHDRTLQQTSTVVNAAYSSFPTAITSGTNVSVVTAPLVGGTPFTTTSGTGCTAGITTNSAALVFGLQG